MKDDLDTTIKIACGTGYTFCNVCTCLGPLALKFGAVYVSAKCCTSLPRPHYTLPRITLYFTCTSILCLFQILYESSLEAKPLQLPPPLCWPGFPHKACRDCLPFCCQRVDLCWHSTFDGQLVSPQFFFFCDDKSV